MPVSPSPFEMPNGYADFLSSIKKLVHTERLKTVLSANATQVLMYWDIGYRILQKQEKVGWGAKVIDRMSYDLKEEFPDMQGFSVRNLKYMRKFAQDWPDREIVQRAAAQIPWRNNQAILDKIKDYDLRIWYAEQNAMNG